MPQSESKRPDLWFKVVGMLQQNWAFIEPRIGAKPGILFIEDDGVIFDEVEADGIWKAGLLLRSNGFRSWEDDIESHAFLTPPVPPFVRDSKRQRPIYSSGEFWRSP